MSRKYYVWKNPACGGVNIQWVELTGKEFYAMVNQPENKNRRFIRLGKESLDDNVIYIEATESQYISWKRENDILLYRKKVDRVLQPISLDGEAEGNESLTLGETVADPETNTEESVDRILEADKIKSILTHFTEEERKVLYAIYVEERTFSSVAKKLGVSRQAISKRAKRLLKRFKNYFENFEK